MSSESESEEEYVIERILEETGKGGKLKYLVKWQGYDEETWEPAANLAKTEALAEWTKNAAAGKGKGKPAKKVPAKPESDDESGSDEEYQEDSEASSEAEWKPKGSKSGGGTSKAPAATKKSPATLSGNKVVAKRQRDPEQESLPETLTADFILGCVESWDAPKLKALASALAKESTVSKYHVALGGLKGTGKKAEVCEDVTVAIRSVYSGLGTRPIGRYHCGGSQKEEGPAYRSERIESAPLVYGMGAEALRKAVEAAFRRAHEGVVNERAKKAFRPEAKALLPRLEVLEPRQLAQLVCSLVDAGNGMVAVITQRRQGSQWRGDCILGHVDDATVYALLPSADLEPVLKECEKLVNAIRRALPNSRWGSCTDHFGYKRCASAVNTAKRKILEGAKQFKGAKQWATAKEWALRN